MSRFNRYALITFSFLIFQSSFCPVMAQVWKDPAVNQQNREPRRAHFFAFESVDKAKGNKTASDRFLSMEGMWKFNFVKDHQDAPKDFFSLKTANG